MKSLVKSIKEIEVIEAKRFPVRPKCPFYGFEITPLGIVDNEGNQCALMIYSYSPCHMELKGNKIDYNKCGFSSAKNSQKGIDNIMENMNIFPEEFKPRNSSSWSGINFKAWYHYIMD